MNEVLDPEIVEDDESIADSLKEMLEKGLQSFVMSR